MSATSSGVVQLHVVNAPPVTGSQVSVLCVDDQNLVRACVVAIIEQDPGLRVAAEARTVTGACERFTDARPDVTVVSLHPRRLDSLEVIRAIRLVDPRARIVVYARDDSDAVYRALKAGATGFVLKDARAGDLIRVVREVHARKGDMPDETRRRIEARGGRPILTTREVEVLELFTQGLRSQAVSATLRISPHTVRVHMRSAYTKLGVHGRVAALTEAMRRGFVQLAAGRPAKPADRPPSTTQTGIARATTRSSPRHLSADVPRGERGRGDYSVISR
jgi:DNA-binding NarL/FixJ family response regulator